MKRLLSFFLVISMLALLVACADANENENVDQTKPEESNAQLETQQTSDDVINKLAYNLPELDFGGRVINVASSDRDWWDDEVSVEGLNGEIVNDAVYMRNLNVEERLKVKINNIKIPYASSNSSTVDAVSKAVQAGTPDYDIMFANAYVTISASLKNIFRNLREVDYLDLERPYWSQGFNETAEYRDLQFLATGSIALSTMRFAFVTIFNKAVFDNNGIPYLYDVVREGKWTIDYQYQLVRDMYIDVNGNNIADESDMYGFITNDFIGSDPYWVCCEVPILGRDSEGRYSYILDSGKLSSLVDKLIPLYDAPGTFNIKHKTADAEQDDMRRMFSNGNGAMITLRLMEVEHADMRNMKDPYGIVPMPKYSESQEKYHTLLHDQFTVVTVVGTVPESDFEIMGAFLEDMAYESHITVVPAYFEIALKHKYSSDPESWEMLDLVVENITCDAGILFTSSLANIHHNLRTIMQARNNTVSSTFKSITKAVERMVTNNLNASLEKLAG